MNNVSASPTPFAPVIPSSASLGIRIPQWLRERLVASAEASKRSLNAEIVHRLETSMTGVDTATERVLKLLDLPRHVRLRSRNTSADVETLLAAARHLQAESVLLGARANALNGAVLVVIIETPHLTCVMDDTYLNLARRPRELEVRDLLREFDSLGLLDGSRYCSKLLVDDTSNRPPAEAIQAIAAAGEPEPFDLESFLQVLAQRSPYTAADFAL